MAQYIRLVLSIFVFSLFTSYITFIMFVYIFGNYLTNKSLLLSICVDLTESSSVGFDITFGIIVTYGLFEVFHHWCFGRSSIIFIKLIYDPNRPNWSSDQSTSLSSFILPCSAYYDNIRSCSTRSLLSIIPIITLPEDYSSLPYFLSFNLFSYLVTAFYIFSLITYLLVPYIFYIISRYIIPAEYRIKFIIIFLFASIVFFTIPLAMLITSIIISIPSLFFYLHYNFKNKFFNMVFSAIVFFLFRHNILQFLMKLHTKLFHEILDWQFLFLMNNLFIFSLAYTVISRFYLLFVITGNLSLFSLNNILLLNVTLFLCLFMWCLRLIVNICFYIGSSKQSFIHLFGEDIPPSSSSPSNLPQGPNPPSQRSIFSFWNRHTYHNYNSFARPRWVYISNMTLGTCTLILGCVGTYIAYQAWQTTIESNKAMDRNSQAMNTNSQAMNRQSDQADVEAGRMSSQDYVNKWFPKK